MAQLIDTDLNEYFRYLMLLLVLNLFYSDVVLVLAHLLG